MKFFTSFLTVLAVALTTGLSAQIAEITEPYSFSNGIQIFDKDLVSHVVPAPDMGPIIEEDVEREELGEIPFDGRRLTAGWNLNSHGEWLALENGDMLWKLKIHSPGALSLELFYDDFYLPEGAELHLYSEDLTEYIGPYTTTNNSKSGYFSSHRIHGETTILEYYEPAEVAGLGRISIEDVGYRYRDLGLNDNERADPCQVDVNCPEGDDWQDEKHGVVRLRITTAGGGLSYCSGSLINNTALDCTPYVLSAFHCIDDIANSQNLLDQLKFYYNFERSTCGQGPAPAGQFTEGCQIVARSNNAGGNGSDFVLFELDDDIPENYEPYWNGWNLQSTTISGGGVCIHHPAGDEKKISTSFNNFISTSYGPGGPQAYWRVIWSETESGHGVTEGGSSGSPLFDNNHLIVGTLTGGLSFCNSVQPGGQDDPDWYGKISYHWDNNSGSQVIDLEDLLDPLGTGQTVLLGTYAPCSTTGLSESELRDEINLYPNPTSGQFTVDLQEIAGDVERITVYNSMGKVVKRTAVNATQILFDLSSRSAGLYLVTFELANNQSFSQKVSLR